MTTNHVAGSLVSSKPRCQWLFRILC